MPKLLNCDCPMVNFAPLPTHIYPPPPEGPREAAAIAKTWPVERDAEGRVRRWRDLSGNGRDVEQGDASRWPVFVPEALSICAFSQVVLLFVSIISKYYLLHNSQIIYICTNHAINKSS